MKRLLIIPFLLIAIKVYALPQLDGVLSNALLTASQKVQLKENLKGLIHIEATPAKNDYVDDFNRGTVYFNPDKGNRFGGREALKVRNYSYHKIIIPDGTTIEGVNFSQKDAHTNAISGKNLTFISCNLNNIEIDPTWSFQGGLQIHSRYRNIEENDKTYKIYEVEQNNVFMEIDREEITP